VPVLDEAGLMALLAGGPGPSDMPNREVTDGDS